MTGTPTFALPATFLGTMRQDRDARICVAGIPFDIGTTNRSGARFGPQAIRQASRMLVDGDHPAARVDLCAGDFADIGNFTIALGDTTKSLQLIERQAAEIGHLLALGGDHAVSLALLRALAKRKGGPLALVHFDAHVDTWPDSFGQPHGHGSVFFHAIKEGLVDPRRMVQIGIRSPVQKAVMDWTRGQGVTVVEAESVHRDGPEAIAKHIREVIGDSPVYLSFDIDALDPAFAPGTGTPEIGGLATWQTQAILRRLAGLTFVGCDVVEVAPPYDVAEITALAGATVAWEYLALARTTAS
jgi:agmatinase